jgi:hypothetical protein
MKYKMLSLTAFLLAAGMCSSGLAEEYTHTLYGQVNTAGGQVYRGQVKRGIGDYDPVDTLNHKWLQSCAINLGDSVSKGDRLSMIVDLVGVLRYSLYIDESNSLGTGETHFPNWGFFINRACATYIFGDTEKKPFSLTLGVFHYKYNPEVKNLGEYLFRSTPHPNFIKAPFDESFAQLLGLKFSSLLLGGNLRQDLILSNECTIYPLGDFSLAYVAGYTINPLLDIGVGGQACRIFPVNNRDYLNDLSNDGRWYYASPEDSAADIKKYYSFADIKLMGRINAHPLASMQEIKVPVIGTLFGKNDLNLFVEADVLGLKNIPTHNSPGGPGDFYNKLSERIPVTFGINAPTNPLFAYGLIPTATFLFAKESSMLNDMGARLMWSAGSVGTTAAMLLLQNMLGLNVRPDELSFEFEYWSNRYPNSNENGYVWLTPVPDWKLTDATSDHNRWRWSVFSSKKIGDFFVKFQVAHDHLIAYVPMNHRFNPKDNLGPAGNWWWTIKTGYSF